MALGCGDWEAFVQTRGGDMRLATLEYSDLAGGRILDEMSSGSVTVGVDGMTDQECCRVLGTLNPWEHELSMWRDGAEVWVGPIIEPEWAEQSVSIPARDLFQWFERRLLPYDRAFENSDLAEIFAQYALDALEADTSPNISLAPGPCGVTGQRFVAATAFRRAADEMRELARSGLDFTAIGRTIRTGGAAIPTPALPTLTSEWVDRPRLRRAGLSAASEVTVIGASTTVPDVPISGVSGGASDPLGLVQLSFQEPSILDTASALSAADTRLEMLRNAPEYLTCVLLPDAPMDFADLVPGALVPVRLDVGCRRVEETLRLLSVSWRVAESEGIVEEVSINLIPVGTEN